MRRPCSGGAISALRLATPGAIAAGPVLFEGGSTATPTTSSRAAVAAQMPDGEPTRLDQSGAGSPPS